MSGNLKIITWPDGTTSMLGQGRPPKGFFGGERAKVRPEPKSRRARRPVPVAAGPMSFYGKFKVELGQNAILDTRMSAFEFRLYCLVLAESYETESGDRCCELRQSVVARRLCASRRRVNQGLKALRFLGWVGIAKFCGSGALTYRPFSAADREAVRTWEVEYASYRKESERHSERARVWDEWNWDRECFAWWQERERLYGTENDVPVPGPEPPSPWESPPEDEAAADANFGAYSDSLRAAREEFSRAEELRKQKRSHDGAISENVTPVTDEELAAAVPAVEATA
jgi:hypothetical protein